MDAEQLKRLYATLLLMTKPRERTYEPDVYEAYLTVARKFAELHNKRAELIAASVRSAAQAAALAKCAEQFPKHYLMKSAERKACDETARARARASSSRSMEVQATGNPRADYDSLNREQHDGVALLLQASIEQAAGHKEAVNLYMQRLIPEALLFSLIDLGKLQELLDKSSVSELHGLLSVLNRLQAHSDVFTGVRTRRSTVAAIIDRVVYARGVFGGDVSMAQLKTGLARADTVLLQLLAPVLSEKARRLVPTHGGANLGAALGVARRGVAWVYHVTVGTLASICANVIHIIADFWDVVVALPAVLAGGTYIPQQTMNRPPLARSTYISPPTMLSKTIKPLGWSMINNVDKIGEAIHGSGRQRSRRSGTPKRKSKKRRSSRSHL
jgi:hypothetical protein